MVDIQTLRQVPLFAELPDAELARIAVQQLERFPAGTLIFREGDVGERFYVVLEGQIAIIKAIETEDERWVGTRGPGEFVGEMSLINQDGLRTASVRVVEDARLLVLTRADFDTLMHRHPALAFTMLSVLSMRLRSSQDAALLELHEKNQRLSQAYAELKAAQARIIEQETLARELQLAREIQRNMLPTQLPRLPGLDLGACMIPARSVGGDFYDVLVLDDDQIGLVIGDVSGKGVPAALFMALTCSLLRAESRRGTTPEAALQAVNRQLLTYPTHSMFVTVLYAILRRSTGEFAYVRAGHELPLLLAADGADCSPQRRPGQPLGLFDNCLLDIQSLVLPAGGTLLLYTDGLNEAMTAEYEQFGREGVLATACAALDTSAQALCDQLVAAANAHSAGMPQHDDITLLALRARH